MAVAKVEDNISYQATAKGNSLSKLIFRESEEINTLGKNRQDNNMPAKDLVNKKYILVTSLFRAMTIYFNRRNNI